MFIVIDMMSQNLSFVVSFNQTVSCLLSSMEVNRHQDSFCFNQK